MDWEAYICPNKGQNTKPKRKKKHKRKKKEKGTALLKKKVLKARKHKRMEFVGIYMRGQVMKVPVGTVLDMSIGTAEEKKVSVKVQGIEFLVSHTMLYAKSKLLAKDNFFTNALRFNVDDDDVAGCTTKIRSIEMKDGEALYYPVLFDYMRRCLSSSKEQLYDYEMKTDDAVALHKLLGFLCVLDESKMLPVSEDGRFAYVAIVPETCFGESRHDVSLEMCMDPDFVRLCMLPADEREQSVLDQIKEKYYIDRFSMNNVRDTAIHKIPRGSRFAIEDVCVAPEAPREAGGGRELEIMFQRHDYMSA